MKVPFNLTLFKKYGSSLDLLVYENDQKPADIWISDYLIDIGNNFPIRTCHPMSNLIKAHKLNGKYNVDNSYSSCDLYIIVPDEINEIYQNIYYDGITDINYTNLAEANKNSFDNRIAVNKIIINKTTGEITSEIII